jgi:hypothetical protein
MVNEVFQEGKLMICNNKKISVADPGCLSRIPDPTFSNPDPRHELSPSRIRIKEFIQRILYILTQKNGFLALENMIRVVHSVSRIRMRTFYPSRIPVPGVKKAPDPGSGSATLKKL